MTKPIAALCGVQPMSISIWNQLGWHHVLNCNKRITANVVRSMAQAVCWVINYSAWFSYVGTRYWRVIVLKVRVRGQCWWGNELNDQYGKDLYKQLAIIFVSQPGLDPAKFDDCRTICHLNMHRGCIRFLEALPRMRSSTYILRVFACSFIRSCSSDVQSSPCININSKSYNHDVQTNWTRAIPYIIDANTEHICIIVWPLAGEGSASPFRKFSSLCRR